jgi:hypothetical protein
MKRNASFSRWLTTSKSGKEVSLKLTAGIPDLHTGLTNVNGNDFAHFFFVVKWKKLYRNVASNFRTV